MLVAADLVEKEGENRKGDNQEAKTPDQPLSVSQVPQELHHLQAQIQVQGQVDHLPELTLNPWQKVQPTYLYHLIPM